MNSYSETEYEIFSRSFILREFSEENIRKLSNLNVGIVGIGGIGCPLSEYLIRSGIKQLTLIDGDVVEKSNLNRQILFDYNNLGEKKVKVAKTKLELINPETNINIIDANLDNDNLSTLSNCTIIVDATDDWKVSRLLNQYCLHNSINFMFSSVVKNDLQIIIFDNSIKNKHLCLNCIFPNIDDVELPRCESVGISGISAGMAGLISAQKIINFSLDLRDETNILTVSDCIKLNIENIIVKSKHDCCLKSV